MIKDNDAMNLKCCKICHVWEEPLQVSFKILMVMQSLKFSKKYFQKSWYSYENIVVVLKVWLSYYKTLVKTSFWKMVICEGRSSSKNDEHADSLTIIAVIMIVMM